MLEAAAIEILEKTNANNPSRPNDDLQQRFKTMPEECGLKYEGHPVKAFAPVSPNFLKWHADLL